MRDRSIEYRIGFMGGAAVAYLLARRTGEVLTGDILAQFGITCGEIAELSEGRDFNTIQYKPDHPERLPISRIYCNCTATGTAVTHPDDGWATNARVFSSYQWEPDGPVDPDGRGRRERESHS